MRLLFPLAGLLGLIGLLLLPHQTTAQICDPDTQYTVSGIYPTTLPDACTGSLYDEVLTVVVPRDTLYATPFGNIRVNIDSIVLVDIQNRPAGFSFQCNPASCAFPGNSLGCVRLTGTPMTTGTFNLAARVNLHVATPLGPVVVADSSLSINLTVSSPPTAVISGPTAICPNDTVTLDGGAGFSAYLWSTGDTTQSIRVSAAGSYGLRVGSGSCVDSTSVTLAPATSPVITTNTYPASCGQSNGSARAFATGIGPFAYQWSTGTSGDSVSNLGAGSYTVTVTGSNGCSTTETVNISNIGGPTLSPPSISNVNCFGGSTGSIGLMVSGGTPPYTYAWNSGQSSPTLTGLSAGNYTVSVTDANNCVSTATYTVSQPPSLVVSANGDFQLDCAGDTADFTLSGAGGTLPYTFGWSTGASGPTTQLTSGIYRGFVADGNGCQDSIVVSISEPQPLTATVAVENPACSGDENGEATLAVNGGTPAYAITWDNGQTGNSLTNVGAGTYEATVVDANGCTISSTATLDEPNPLTVSAVTTTDVGGQGVGSITLEIAGGTEPYDIDWSHTTMNSPTLSMLPAGSYFVTIIDANGCEDTLTVRVTFPVGIEDELRAGIERFSVAPVPVNDQLQLSIETNQATTLAIDLFDAAGKRIVVFEQPLGTQHELNIPFTALSPGVYLLRATTSRGSVWRKVIK